MIENDCFIKKNIIILLTGCVVPNARDVLVIKNANVRKIQYVNAINWYLQNTSYFIVFCENSGTNIAPFFSNEDKNRIEFLTYSSPEIIPDRGKGYKEMEILEYAYNHSKYLHDADIIIKGTGRLVLRNIVKIIINLQSKSKDINFISSWMSISRQTSDSRFFFCSPSYLNYFLSYKDKINNHSNFEDNLSFSIRDRNNMKFHFFYPCRWYRISGVSGGFGNSYDITELQYIRLCVKNIIFKFVFSLGYWPRKIMHY